jgi:assimilatory nitrate reductase catalytic subunit
MTDTHCPYCALQCAQTITPGSDDAAGRVTVEPRAFPTNVGGMCQKGWTSADVLTVPDRITSPLRRSGDGFEVVSWDVALDDIAARVQAIGEQDGHDAVAVFGGGGLTNEKAYQLGKFARLALHTRNIDYNGRFCMSSAASTGACRSR